MRQYSVIWCVLLTLVIGVGCSGGQVSANEKSSSSAIDVIVAPASATLSSLETVQFTALVENTPHVSVNWAASGGTISSAGLYQAPEVSSDTAVSVTATSVSDPTKSEVASLTITPKSSDPTQTPVSNPAAGKTTIKQSFFGADFNGSEVWPPTDGQHQVATLGALRLWDDGVKWGQINTASGVYNWSKLDNWIAKAQAQHIDVLYTFGDTPKFAGSIPPKSPCNSPGPYSCSSPKDVHEDGTGSDSDFSAFVTALVNRYKGRIAYYELWNEADCDCYFAGTQAQMVRMGKDAAAIIRSHDQAAKILSPSAHGGTMATWFDGYIKAGGAKNFDIVDVHMRGAGSSNSSPEAFLTVYNDVMNQLSANKLTGTPLWDGEHGIKKSQLTDTDELAGFTAREIVLRAGVGIQRQYVYTWDNNQPYGLQGNDSGTAWNTVADWLIGHTISPCVANGKVYTCNVDNGQIVWDTAQSCHNNSCTTSKYTYPSSYSWQTDLNGKKTALSGKTVSIGYKPIFLTSR
jgi:hypothetical protein